MVPICLIDQISEKCLTVFTPQEFTLQKQKSSAEGILMRSSILDEADLSAPLCAIARAGAGVNNIPVDACSRKGIAVFNTPGANANAVKELVLAGLLLSSRRIVDGINWVKTLSTDVPKIVEKEKGQFTGPEIQGKRLGVIGLGAIGVLVANAARGLGMEVSGYDPYLSVQAAWKLNSAVQQGKSLEEFLPQCDYISLHLPLSPQTKGFFNESTMRLLKPGVKLLNFARGPLVDNEALSKCLDSGQISCYVTDFPEEPLLKMKNVIAIPHLGASTPESEENCAQMAAIQLKEYLLYGNIKNSVNFPDCELPISGNARIGIVNQNIPNMVGSIATIFANSQVNIDTMLNKSKGDWAYTLINVDTFRGQENEIIAKLMQIPGIVKARLIIGEEK